MEETKIVACYCCQKEFKETEITKIDAGKGEFRFICKTCNHLKYCENCGILINNSGTHCSVCQDIDNTIGEIRREKNDNKNL